MFNYNNIGYRNTQPKLYIYSRMCSFDDCTGSNFKDTTFCWKHRGQIKKIAENNVEVSIVGVEEMPPQVSTPVIEVVDMSISTMRLNLMIME